MEMNENGKNIRPPAFAGTFYPANPNKLDTMINEFLDRAPGETVDGDIFGIIAPHAGYVYSGPTAAAAYKQVMGHNYTSAIVLAPSHRELLRTASIAQYDSYETPFGILPVNKQLAEAIIQGSENIGFSLKGHDVQGEQSEHSLEVHYLFFRKCCPKYQSFRLYYQKYQLRSVNQSVWQLLRQSIKKKSF